MILQRIDIRDLTNWVGTIHKGILEVTNHVDRDDYPYPKILLDLFRGFTTAFVGMDGSDYKGFILLTPCALEFGSRYLLISAMYSILQTREEWEDAYETVVKPFAIEHNCKWIEFRSERCGWDRVAPHFMFDKIYSIFRREV